MNVSIQLIFLLLLSLPFISTLNTTQVYGKGESYFNYYSTDECLQKGSDDCYQEERIGWEKYRIAPPKTVNSEKRLNCFVRNGKEDNTHAFFVELLSTEQLQYFSNWTTIEGTYLFIVGSCEQFFDRWDNASRLSDVILDMILVGQKREAKCTMLTHKIFGAKYGSFRYYENCPYTFEKIFNDETTYSLITTIFISFGITAGLPLVFFMMCFFPRYYCWRLSQCCKKRKLKELHLPNEVVKYDPALIQGIKKLREMHDVRSSKIVKTKFFTVIKNVIMLAIIEIRGVFSLVNTLICLYESDNLIESSKWFPDKVGISNGYIIIGVYIFIDVSMIIIFVNKYFISTIQTCVIYANYREWYFTRMFRVFVNIFYLILAWFMFFYIRVYLVGQLGKVPIEFNDVFLLVLPTYLLLKEIYDILSYDSYSCYPYVKKIKNLSKKPNNEFYLLFPDVKFRILDVLSCPDDVIANTLICLSIVENRVQMEKRKEQTNLSHLSWKFVTELSDLEIMILRKFFFYSSEKKSFRFTLLYDAPLSVNWVQEILGLNACRKRKELVVDDIHELEEDSTRQTIEDAEDQKKRKDGKKKAKKEKKKEKEESSLEIQVEEKEVIQPPMEEPIQVQVQGDKTASLEQLTYPSIPRDSDIGQARKDNNNEDSSDEEIDLT